MVADEQDMVVADRGVEEIILDGPGAFLQTDKHLRAAEMAAVGVADEVGTFDEMAV